MPYLSRVFINPMRQRGRLLLANPHVAHGAISYGIPGDPTKQRTLWRWEMDNPRRPALLILTESGPDWTHLVEQCGWPHAEGDQFVVRDYSPVFSRISSGREFAFRVTANPVQNTKRPQKVMSGQQRQLDAGRTRGFRLLHRTVENQVDWLVARASSWGFEIPIARTDSAAPGMDDSEAKPAHDLRATPHGMLRFRKNEGGSQVVLAPVTFDGRMIVTNPVLLREKLLAGVGPGKAYGCGLLTLAPLAPRNDA